MSEVLAHPTAPNAAARFVARFDGLKRRLPGSESVRAAASARLAATGFPTLREEDWRYTSLRKLEAIPFEEALTPVGESPGSGEARAMIAAMGLPEVPLLVFVDGRFAVDLSRLPVEHGALFSQSPVFGTLAKPESQAFVALNTMLAEDGAVFDLPAGVDGGTVAIVSLGIHAQSRAIAFHPRHRITLGRGARLSVIEVAAGQGIYLHNPVHEITVGEGATLEHVRLQDEDRAAFHMSTSYVSVAEGATYDSFTLVLGGSLSRTEIHAALQGPNAIVHLNAAQLLSGHQHADFTTAVAHEAPNCASRQTVKNVLADASHGVFQGRIDVAREAQKTDGYQMNQALLLSDRAAIDSKPQLRINADDVKCSHGATVGELDHEQLFYLRSRGVPVAEARSILVRAFLAEAIDPIRLAEGRAVLERAVERWWTRAAAQVENVA